MSEQKLALDAYDLFNHEPLQSYEQLKMQEQQAIGGL